MIDRGALLLATAAPGTYRGAHRPPLDAWSWKKGPGRELRDRYREGVVDGEGVLEDLDEALAMRDEALRLRHPGLDVVVFEVPQGDWVPGALPIASEPPADGLTLTGWDVIELVEPFWSPLAKPAPETASETRNDAGLFETRAAAERFAQAYNAAHPDDEPLSAARIWVLTPR